MLLRRFVRRVRRERIRLYDWGIGLGPRADEPYASHVPILVGVAAVCSPKLLIEFGSGTFSTLSFLDQQTFPSLQRVESFENNREWFEQIRERLPLGGRVHHNFVEGDMYRAVDSANTSAAEMIFIDDSPSAEARVPTVEKVAAQCGTKPLVVLHDNDLWRLRLATRRFEHRVSIETFNPQTCVMWHGHPERKPAIENVSRIIQQFGPNLRLTDIRAWAEVFSRELR
jgi:predicted O-methyltransferase YrrM